MDTAVGIGWHVFTTVRQAFTIVRQAFTIVCHAFTACGRGLQSETWWGRESMRARANMLSRPATVPDCRLLPWPRKHATRPPAFARENSANDFDSRRFRSLSFAAVALTCTLAAACDRRSETAVPQTATTPVAPRAVVAPPPPAVAKPPADPPKPEPQAVQARAVSIRATANVIRAECQRAAGGDWDKWQRQTEPYRVALKARLDALKSFNPPPTRDFDTRYEPLAGRDDFPLFEVSPREYLRHLYDPDGLAQFRKERPVVTVNRWLRQRGIDLIFVPVPKMAEVYIEHFLDPCPHDGVIAPHIRRTLLDLLDEDVEVVDGFPLFRGQRDTDREYLYNTADSHWAPRAMRLMSKELADRIARYSFGARARAAVPVVKAEPGRFYIPGAPLEGHVGELSGQYGWPALTPHQQELATKAQTLTALHVTMPDGREPHDDPRSPVLLMGNSYVMRFREQFIKELNLLVNAHWACGMTTQVFQEFVRDPKSLEHCRVVVWILTEQDLAGMRPLPEPMLSAVASP
jgi:hypothetical protein